jgi:3-phenylpropionate/trans-cinnamate dioxygenase ferredoxin subunit
MSAPTDQQTRGEQNDGENNAAQSWVRVCGASEVTPDQPKAVVAGETPIAVVLHEGEYYAIHDVCSHANVALSEGEVVDCEIECWLHGSMFDLKTGKPSSLPATEPVPVYPVKIEGDDLYVAVKEA